MADLHFLVQVEDLELRDRIRRVMVRLELLSEARAAPTERSHTGKPESKAPPETRDRIGIAALSKPPRERSLFERYLWQFGRAQERSDPQWHYRLLATFAERDYEQHLHGPPASKKAGGVFHIAEGQNRDGAQVEREKGDLVVQEYEGVPAAEVALFEEVNVAWIHKVRELRGRHPDTGLIKDDPRSRFMAKSDEDRRVAVARLAAQKLSQEKVAHELGVSKHTVQRFWPRQEAA